MTNLWVKKSRPESETPMARRVSLFCGIVVAVVGILNVFGWYGHWSSLSELFPDVLPMKFNSGLCFILCGIGVILPWLGGTRISAILGTAVLLYMGLSLVENLSGRDFGIDAVFFNSYQHNDVFPNRASPLTGSSFVITGIALILVGIHLNLRFRLAVIGTGACATTMIGLVAMFGYTFGVENASGWGSYTRMSVYTAATFIALSLGLFLWAWVMAKQTNFNFVRWLPVAGSVTLMAMISLVSSVSFVQAQNSSAWRFHTYSVLNSSQSLLRDIFDFQRGMRGFILADLPSNLTLSNSGSRKALIDLKDLFELTRENPRQQANLRILSRHLNALLAYSNELMATRQQGVQKAVKMESSGIGFKALNETLSDLQRVEDEEHRLLVLRNAKADADFHNTSRLLVWGSILAAVLIVVANILASYEVSRRQKIEDQLRLAMAHQAELVGQAQAAERAKSEFLSNMSHELRTPLNAILGFAQLMESDVPPPSPSQSKSITQILRSGWYLLKLINEVLDLAAVDSGKLSISKEAVSLSELLSTCKEMLEPQARERDIQMNFPDLGAPVFVRADHTRLKQILLNLLSNALKYNNINGTVTVNWTLSSSGRIRILIKDTGPGLTPEKIAQLFTPFNRLGQEAGNVEGTGIGLVMSKRLAELMDGTLGVESTPGTGSTFWCELPVAKAPEASSESLPTDALDIWKFQGLSETYTLLYVEDNPANMALVKELIERFPSVRLVTAEDAVNIVELARSTRPDVVLMDVNLPGISGIRAFELLRKNPSTSKIPVIALSASAIPRDVAKGVAAGFSSYLTKPIQIKEFEKALKTTLIKQKSGSIEKHNGQLVGHS